MPKPKFSDEDIQRADIRRQIRNAVRKSDPNAERMRAANDTMVAVELEESQKRATALQQQPPRAEKMATSMSELKDMLNKVKSKRADVAGGTTTVANVKIAPVVGPNDAPPAPFVAKSKTNTTVLPFSEQEFGLIVDRHIEGTSIRKALNPDSRYDKGEIHALSIATINIRDDAPQEDVTRYLAALNHAWKTYSQEEEPDELDFAFDLLGEPGNGQKLRVKWFCRDEDLDFIYGFAKEYADDFLGDEDHPAVQNARKFFNAIAVGVEFGDDLNELIKSDNVLASAQTNMRVHIEANFPHAHKEYLHEAAMQKLLESLSQTGRGFDRRTSKVVSSGIFLNAVPSASERHEVNITANSIENAVGSVVRTIAPAIRKFKFENDPNEDMAKYLYTTSFEEIVARILTRRILFGITGMKLKDRIFFQLAILLKETDEGGQSELLEPIIFNGSSLLDALESVQMFGKTTMGEVKFEGMKLDGLLPTCRADLLDMLHQMKLADKLDFTAMKKDLGIEDEEEEEEEDDEEYMEELLEEDNYIALHGYEQKRDEPLGEAEGFAFDGPTGGYSDEGTNLEKNCLGLVNDLSERTSAARVALLGNPKVTDQLIHNWVPATKPKPNLMPCLDEDDEDEEQLEHRLNTLTHQGRTIEIAQTCDTDIFAKLALTADLLMVVFDPNDEEAQEDLNDLKEVVVPNDEDDREELRNLTPMAPWLKPLTKKSLRGNVLMVSVNASGDASAPDSELYKTILPEEATKGTSQFAHLSDAENQSDVHALLDRVVSQLPDGKGVGKSSGPWDTPALA